jgi:hypothetical protein
MANLTPPPAVPQRGDRTTFSSRVDAFLVWMATLVGQLNTFLGQLNTIAAGGGYSLPYNFWDTTGPSGQGGFVTIDTGSTVRTTTRLWIDLTTAAGLSVDALLTNAMNSSSASKGYVRLQKLNDPAQWATFTVTSYNKLSATQGVAFVTPDTSSQVAPFANGDSIILFFQRTGDKGDKGDLAYVQLPVMHVRQELASGTSGGVGNTSYSTRSLNITKKNTITGASLSANSISLPAGTYRFRSIAPAAINGGHQARLNIGGTFFYGTSGYGAGTGANTHSFVNTFEVQLGGQTSVTLEHKLNASANTGVDFGVAAAMGSGSVEVFAEVIVEKVA